MSGNTVKNLAVLLGVTLNKYLTASVVVVETVYHQHTSTIDHI